MVAFSEEAQLIWATSDKRVGHKKQKFGLY